MAQVLPYISGMGSSSVSSEDNECAQALLELAMSTFCAPHSVNGTGKPMVIARIPVKRQLTPEEQEREEIVKRIKLDHSYYWVQGSNMESFQSYCDSIIQTNQANTMQGAEDVDVNFQKYPAGIKTGKENALDMVAKWRLDNMKREKKVALKSNVLHTKSQNRYGDPYEFEEDATASSMSSLGDDEDSNHSAVNSGLDLLLKCLAENQPTFQCRSEGESVASQDEDYQEDSETESEDETGYRRQPDVEYEHKCRHCLKTFSKKRYLTKHVRRMHPDGMITSPEEVSTACPNCLKIVSKRNFQRHLMICQHDSVACPLCGVHIRREHMGRHKEKMHNAQRNLEIENKGPDCGLHQLADLVFMHSQGKKTESKSPNKDPHKVGASKKNAVKKKSPANSKKTKEVKAAVKRKVTNRKAQKVDAPNPRQTSKAKSPKSSAYENISLEANESLLDSPEEPKSLSLRNVLMGNDSKGLSPIPSTSRINAMTPVTHLSPRSEQVKLSSPSENGSLVMKPENSVKSKVILQPTRIKNMVSVSV